MKTVGEIFARERKKKGLEIKAVAEVTKIRTQFIEAIEQNDFAKIPSTPTAYGFIKNYAEFLGIPSKFILAVFRRDFAEDKKGRIVPRGLVKPLDKPKFFSSPRLGLFIFSALFIIAILAYLSFQYFSLVRGPFLEVTSPTEAARTGASLIEVTGRTEPDATVTVNGRLISLSTEGEFVSAVTLSEGKNLVIVESTNKLGKTKRVIREVFKD